MSWVAPNPRNPLYIILHEITEPILGPIRQLLPRMGMIDLSPMIAGFLLIMVAQAAARALN